MINNSKFKFNIQLNFVRHDKNISKSITEHQAMEIGGLFENDPYFCSIVKYEFISCGAENILVSTEYIETLNDKFKMKVLNDFNSRLEIHLKAK